MRLRQLANKLGIDQHEIIDYLTQQGIEVGNHGNAKIPDEHLPLLYSRFLPPKEKEKNILPDPELPKQAKIHKEESDEPSPVEVIRAKKIKLEGIKVIGKIELPEPPERPLKEKEEKRSNGKKKYLKNRPKNKPRKKQDSYAQKVAREEKQRQKELLKKKKKLKAQKKLHYEQKIASIGKKPIKKPVKTRSQYRSNPTTAARQKKTIHKNPLVRFWHWLNGRYD